MMTEVNMNVATYIKFDDITNALVDVKPTKLVNFDGQQQAAAANNQMRSNFLLDTSFNVQLAFNNAIDRLNNFNAQPTSAQQTPALGKLNFPSNISLNPPLNRKHPLSTPSLPIFYLSPSSPPSSYSYSSSS